MSGYVGMNIDVTDRHAAVEELREADHLKDEFLAVLGHELRNPLAAIRNTLQGLSPELAADGGHGERAWQLIDRQSRHMARLVSDLLDVERIKRGRLRLARQPVEMCQCARDAAEALRGQLDAAGLEFVLELPARPVIVHADPERLVQIVDNLLRNSINYTARGGRVALSVHEAGTEVTIAVEDTGIGIEPAEVAQLFEPYYQGNCEGTGLGLGLTLVKRLVEMHGGRVAAHSAGRGRGARFEFTLPLAHEAPAPARAATQPATGRPVLVIDDQRDLADSFAALLGVLGQSVQVAYNGEDALALAREARPRVAFLDLAMPGMDGHELARRLRREFPPEALALVAVSGYGNRADPLEPGPFTHRLLKPVDAAALVDLLNGLE